MRKELRGLIHECGVPGIIVTHDLQDVADIGDWACLLDQGRIAMLSRADEFMKTG
jgi:ABC-type sulfate/molybdate transport systems ATPase subunit